jgi:hypothetical protein
MQAAAAAVAGKVITVVQAEAQTLAMVEEVIHLEMKRALHKVAEILPLQTQDQAEAEQVDLSVEEQVVKEVAEAVVV